MKLKSLVKVLCVVVLCALAFFWGYGKGMKRGKAFAAAEILNYRVMDYAPNCQVCKPMHSGYQLMMIDSADRQVIIYPPQN